MPGFLLTSSCLCFNRCYSLLPLWSAHSSCRLVYWSPTSTVKQAWWPSRLFSGSLETCWALLSLICWWFLIRHCAMRYTHSTFSRHNFNFNHMVLYYLFSAKLRSGGLFWFWPCVDCLRPWTMIFPWIFLFLYRQVFACSNKQNVYSRINPRRTTFTHRLVASNKLNINQLKF